MNKLKSLLLVFAILLSPLMLSSTAYAATAPNCKESVFGVPTWYKYLIDSSDDGGTPDDTSDDTCELSLDFSGDLTGTVSKLLTAVFEIILFIAGIVAVIFIIWGGFQYMISQGEPDKAKGAKTTITNAIIGLVITMVASGVVGFIGRSL